MTLQINADIENNTIGGEAILSYKYNLLSHLKKINIKNISTNLLTTVIVLLVLFEHNIEEKKLTVSSKIDTHLYSYQMQLLTQIKSLTKGLNWPPQQED